MTAAIRKACVIGYPVAHSRSPMIHGHWLRTLGLQGAYERAEAAPADFAAFLRDMPERGYVGGNVTVPHKEQLFALAGELTDLARRIGSANTIWFENGQLCADSTDGHGFLGHLDATVPEWEKALGRSVILGAGGAARCIAFALASRGVTDIAIVNRNPARAEALARDVGRVTRAFAWTELPTALREASLLINTTSLGMAHQPPLDCPLDGLREDAIVNDIVYAPLETPLLRTARARDLRTVDGLGMLLHQAAPGFARWFGVMPAVTDELRSLVEADIQKSA